jgi:hypothetical protein
MFDKITTLVSLGFGASLFCFLIWKGPWLLDQKVQKGRMGPEKAARLKRYVRPFFWIGLVLVIVLLIAEMKSK